MNINNIKKIKDKAQKYFAWLIGCVGVLSICYQLDVLSQGNKLGTGMGTFIFALIGLWTIMENLKKIIFKEKKNDSTGTL